MSGFIVSGLLRFGLGKFRGLTWTSADTWLLLLVAVLASGCVDAQLVGTPRVYTPPP